MTGIELFNAITKIDDDVIDRISVANDRTRDLHIKKRKAFIKYASIAACFVLVAVVSGIILANRNHSLSGINELASGNPDTSNKIVLFMDWPYYKTSEEVIEASTHIYAGKVTGISFTVLDGRTGLEDLDPVSESTSRMFYTVYTVEITDSYKGTSNKTVKIAVNGGISGSKESEQVSLIRNSGLKFNGIPIMSEKIELSVGQSYLFCIHRIGDYDHMINPDQFAFDLSSKDAKTIIACCK
ncbi:MAG: hypothetical protein IJR89_05370 [Clostridia bacterium]|nr:hypothetical protein [Clostridia bacterium]